MSEFDKARHVLHRTSVPVFSRAEKIDTASRLLMSGDSPVQPVLLRQYVQTQPMGKVILSHDDRDAFWRELCTDPRVVIIRNSSDTRTYHPFAGHSARQIQQMLCALPEAQNANADLKLLIRTFAQILELDESLLEYVAENGCTPDLLEERLDILLERRRLPEARYNMILRQVHSYTNAYPELEVLLTGLPDFLTHSVRSGLRAGHSLRSVIESGRSIVFVFDNDYNSASDFDRTLLSLVASDMDLTLKNRTADFSLVIDDLPYLYIQPFLWAFHRPNGACVLNLCSIADYPLNHRYAQLIRTCFDLYMVFAHNSQDMCQFWSDTFGPARIAEYSYGNTSTNTTRYPMLSPVNQLFGLQQDAETVNYQYVDKNLYPSYTFRNLGPKEYFLYERKFNRISQRLLSL